YSTPTKSAPAASASFTFSPCAITSTRTFLPVPLGRLTVPRTTWSACLGSTPSRTATSTDSSNLAYAAAFTRSTASRGGYSLRGSSVPTAAQAVSAPRRGGAGEGRGVRQVRRVGGRGRPAGRRSQARRPGGARHREPAQWHRQEGPRAGDRAGREGEGSGSGGRRFRGSRVRPEDQGRLARHRR